VLVLSRPLPLWHFTGMPRPHHLQVDLPLVGGPVALVSLLGMLGSLGRPSVSSTVAFIGSLVTHTFPLGSYAEALAAAASPEALKVHVDPTISSWP
jgi:hypothetical protein